MRYDRFLAVRNIARSAGLARLVSAHSQVRAFRRRREYERHRPARVSISLDGVSAQMLVADALEYARALAWQDDAHILAALLNRLREGDVGWDIGANVGLYTVLLSGKVGERGTVVAFEPEPRTYRRLRENIACNARRNVLPLELALGAEKTRMNMSITSAPSSGTHRISLEGGLQSGSCVLVDVCPGDEALQQHNLPVPQVVKIDVEGAEEAVILGMRSILANPRCHTLVCEVHFGILQARGEADAPRRIAATIADYGFNVSWLDRSHLLAERSMA